MFQNREDAGQQLAKKIENYRGADAVVLALPRGGLVVGREIARALHLPLDIVVTRKIGHPTNPEYAICAVDEKGTLLCNESERKLVSEEWLIEKVERERREAERRTRVYRAGREPIYVEGKTAIITDDGIATGLTMRLAVRSLKAQKPARIVVAVPVAPPDVISTLKQEVDEVIVLTPPPRFAGAVGAHYHHFDQVEDETVICMLHA